MTKNLHRSVCPYDCPDTCGLLVEVEAGRAIRVTGDPQHPMTRGLLCPKMLNYERTVHSPRRLTTPLLRTGVKGSGQFEAISWDEAIAGNAKRVKETRDRTFVAKNGKGQTVNRTPGMAVIGGCTDTSEFAYLLWKSSIALGAVYRDHQARV